MMTIVKQKVKAAQPVTKTCVIQIVINALGQLQRHGNAPAADHCEPSFKQLQQIYV